MGTAAVRRHQDDPESRLASVIAAKIAIGSIIFPTSKDAQLADTSRRCYDSVAGGGELSTGSGAR